MAKSKPRSEGRYIVPNCCLETKPTPQSVLFCSTYINLSTISLYTHITVSHLSKIFSGKRQPSLKAAKKIAVALNMDYHSFLTRLEEHTNLKKVYLKKVVNC